MSARNAIMFSSVLVVTANAYATPDHEAVIKLLEAQSKAESAFPRTLDVDGLLKYYAKDAVQITNGKSTTLGDTKKNLEFFEEMINLGKQLGVSSRRSNITAVTLSPNYVMATFDHTTKAAVAGEVMIDLQGKCSSLVKRSANSWAIQHEHCSYEKAPEQVPDVPLESVPAPEIK